MAHAGRRRAGVDSLTNQSLAAPRRPTDRPTNDQQPGGRSPRNAWMRSVAVSVSVWPDAGEERDERTIEWHKKKFGHLTTRKICRFFDSLQTGKKRKKLQGPCRGEILGPERYIFWNFFFDFFPSQQESGRQLGGGGGGAAGTGRKQYGQRGQAAQREKKLPSVSARETKVRSTRSYQAKVVQGRRPWKRWGPLREGSGSRLEVLSSLRPWGGVTSKVSRCRGGNIHTLVCSKRPLLKPKVILGQCLVNGELGVMPFSDVGQPLSRGTTY